MAEMILREAISRGLREAAAEVYRWTTLDGPDSPVAINALRRSLLEMVAERLK